MDQKSSRQYLSLLVFFAVILAVVFLVHRTREGEEERFRPGIGEPGGSVHLTLGNPSGATPDIHNPDNYLMRKPYFALSYNNSKGTPNWVSWRLQQSDLGTAPRSQFYPDPDLPRSFRRVTPHDYSGSGFDRGHMCPRSDRTSTTEAANSTFAMTNVIPQARAVNQKAWNDLEIYCLHLVERKRQTLYIVAGPQGQGGTGTNGPADTLANGRVTVPAMCWKVIVVLDGHSGDDIGTINKHTRVIAVIMPNEESVGHGWAKFRTSIQEVERLTGYRFLDRVPADVRESLRTRVDTEHISPPTSRRGEG